MPGTLKQVFAEVFAVEPSAVDKNFSPQTHPSWNSFATVNLIMAIEERYAVELTMDELMRMTSFNNVRDVLAAKGILDD